ncbi:nucleotidyltransferase family protein [Acidobacteria bacterium AB60]|nr:nucleotidyltransferase family protein [Acidobacteria bacterium AB60]
MNVPAIVLAAGASTRLGRAKQLVEYEGRTLLARAIRAAQEGGAERPAIVVLGAGFRAIVPQVLGEAAVPCFNQDWEQGIASSICAGMEVVEDRFPEAEGVLLLTCDQPRLTAAHVSALLAAFTGPAMVASAYGGTVGTPAVFPRSVFPRLRTLQGDTGARRILMDASCAVMEVAFPGGEEDVDRPEDLLRLGG